MIEENKSGGVFRDYLVHGFDMDLDIKLGPWPYSLLWKTPNSQNPQLSSRTWGDIGHVFGHGVELRQIVGQVGCDFLINLEREKKNLSLC